jgi:hypothetical protein
MTRSRSPNYPQISLKDAVTRVAGVYKRDYQAAITRNLAAERVGYSGLNGKSLAVLAALFKYGLMEGRGDEVRVSDLALRIIAHPPGSAERREALQEAATRPELFQVLDQRFPGGRASDAAIRAFLLTQGFIPPAAENALRAWRETRQMLSAETALEPAPSVIAAPSATVTAAPATVPAPEAAPAEPEPAIGTRRAVFGLAEGEVVITAPVFLSPESVNDLQDYLDVFMKRARREAGLE